MMLLSIFVSTFVWSNYNVLVFFQIYPFVWCLFFHNLPFLYELFYFISLSFTYVRNIMLAFIKATDKIKLSVLSVMFLLIFFYSKTFDVQSGSVQLLRDTIKQLFPWLWRHLFSVSLNSESLSMFAVFFSKLS